MNKEIRKEKKKLQKDTCYNKVENISTGKKENQSILQKAKDEYNKMSKVLSNVDLTKVTEAEDNTDLSGELACAGGSCEVV